MAMNQTQSAQLRAFIRQKRRARREQARTARRAVRDVKRDTSLELGLRGVTHPSYEPIGFWFSPSRHGLTIEQCKIATQLLRRANNERPIRGATKQANFRRALWVAGIVSAVRNGRVGNARWGRSMVATKGGNVMRDHGPHILAENRRRLQERRQFEKVWERQQSQPHTYEAWQQAIAEWPVQQSPTDFMSY